MSRLLVTLETHGDDLRAGSWADFSVKLRDIPDPIERRRFTGTTGLSGHTTSCFQIEDIPELTNPDQIEFFQITHNSQESFGHTADNWDATAHVDLLPSRELGAGGPHRFQGDARNLVFRANTEDINWRHIGHANNVVAMTAIEGKLFAATNDNNLWVREPVERNINWRHIGHANNVVAMTAIEGKLFAATNDNNLSVREPVERDINWRRIGHANNVVAMTAIEGKIFAATNDNNLSVREPVERDINWRRIGHANNVVAMTAIEGKLFAATNDNNLSVREPVERDINWRLTGHANNVVAMTAIEGKIFAATNDNNLLVREP